MVVSAPARRVVALLGAAVAWVWSWWALLAGLVWGLGLRCDETCTGDSWRHTQDAWQWNLVVVVGIGAFTAGLALVLFVCLRRPRSAATAALAEAACGAALASALAPGWWEHPNRNIVPLVLTAATAACAAAAALLTSEHDRGR